MADLPDTGFTKVNDVETAQGAPASEALMQKFGSNENFLETEKIANDSDISDNVDDIATNTSNIAAIPTIEFFTKNNLTLTGSFQTVHTFASAPTNVIIQDTASDGTSTHSLLLNATFPLRIDSDGVTTKEYRIAGSNVEARITLGSAVDDDFIGWGYL